MESQHEKACSLDQPGTNDQRLQGELCLYDNVRQKKYLKVGRNG